MKNNDYFKAQGDKLKTKKKPEVNKNEKEFECNSTNNDISTCLSVEDKNSDRSRSNLKRTRAQSSLPGGLNNKQKEIPTSRAKNAKGPN